MKKKELKLYAAQLVESGKALALASLMPDKEIKEAAERLANESIDNVLKQLELFCEDCDYKKIEEILNYGEETNNSAN